RPVECGRPGGASGQGAGCTNVESADRSATWLSLYRSEPRAREHQAGTREEGLCLNGRRLFRMARVGGHLGLTVTSSASANRPEPYGHGAVTRKWDVAESGRPAGYAVRFQPELGRVATRAADKTGVCKRSRVARRGRPFRNIKGKADRSDDCGAGSDTRFPAI